MQFSYEFITIPLWFIAIIMSLILIKRKKNNADTRTLSLYIRAVMLPIVIIYGYRLYGDSKKLSHDFVYLGYEAQCKDKMRAYAKTQGVDPEAYIAANHKYLNECFAYYQNVEKHQTH